MAAVSYIRKTWMVIYTGANGAEVLAAMGPSATLVSDTGTLLTVSYDSGSIYIYEFNIGDAWQPVYQNHIAVAERTEYYVAESGLANGADAVGMSLGVSVTVPILLLGASVERVINWSTAFPDANYKISFLPDANTLGRITAAVKSPSSTYKTASGLTIVISAGLAVTVAGVLHVIAST